MQLAEEIISNLGSDPQAELKITVEINADFLLKELGRGGMGRVFKVEHNLTGRLEAMKVLERGLLDAPEQAERALRETRLQARLDHPNVAAIHNAFWAGEDLVLVMELIEGYSLRRLLDAGRVPLATGMNYAFQVVSRPVEGVLASADRKT